MKTRTLPYKLPCMPALCDHVQGQWLPVSKSLVLTHAMAAKVVNVVAGGAEGQIDA